MKTENFNIDGLIEEAKDKLRKGILSEDTIEDFLQIAFLRGKNYRFKTEYCSNGWHGEGVSEIKTFPLSPEKEAELDKVFEKI